MSKTKYCFFSFIIIILGISCFGKNTNNKNLIISIEQNSSIKNEKLFLEIPVLIEETYEINVIREYLYENDYEIKDKNLEIVFLDKVNFGIPGGDNWIVLLKHDSKMYYDGAYVYVINGNSYKKYYGAYVGNFEYYNALIQDIPGVRLGNSCTIYNDFNDDGINEYFYIDWGLYNLLQIRGFNEDSNKFIDFCNISFTTNDRENNPAPIKHIIYNGTYGFELMPITYREAIFDGNNWIAQDPPDPDNYKRIFYAWNNIQKKYLRIGEIKQE